MVLLFACGVVLRIASLEKITNVSGIDGFGSQFQDIVAAVIFAELNQKEFVYTPFKTMEHNYDNDPYFLVKKEWLINFIGNFELNRGDVQPITKSYRDFFDAHVAAYSASESLKEIKRIFRANKPKHWFDQDHFHIAVHVRRPNSHDCRPEGTTMPAAYYVHAITELRFRFQDKNPLFHLYSQGDIRDFREFVAPDLIFHLNESIESTFISLVLADALVIGTSSMSYVAGQLSQGSVFYTPFWHPPLPHWISVDTL